MACRPGDYDLVVANLPYVREDEWAGLEPEITRYEPRGALVSGADGLDAIRGLVQRGPGRAPSWRSSTPRTRARRCATLLTGGAETRRDLAGRERVTVGTGAVTPEEVATFERCIGGGRRGPVPRRHGVRPGHRARLARGRGPPLPAEGTPAGAARRGDVLPARPGAGGAARAGRAHARPRWSACCPARSPSCCPIRRAGSRWPAARRPTGSACACRSSPASSRRWPRCAGRCSSRARTCTASRTRAAPRTCPSAYARAWT